MATINTNLAGVTSGTQYASAGNNTIYTNLPFNTAGTTDTDVTFVVGANASIDILYNQNFRIDTTTGLHELFGNIEVQGVSSDYTVSSWYGKVQLTHKTSGQVISFQLTKPLQGPPANNSGVNVEFLDGAIAFTSNVNGQGVWTVWATQGGTDTSTWGAGGLATQIPGTFSPGATPLDLSDASNIGYLNYGVNSSDVTDWSGTSNTYTLTTSIDAPGTGAFAASSPQGDSVIYGSFGGDAGNTYNSGDKIQATGLDNTLILSDQGAGVLGDINAVAATVSGIQSLEIGSGRAVSLNTTAGITGWSGLTDIAVANSGKLTLTTGAGVDVTATNAFVGGDNITINGGSTVIVDASGSTGGDISVGKTTAAAGDVTIDSAGAGNQAEILVVSTAGNVIVNAGVKGGTGVSTGTISVSTGGSSVTINQTVAGVVNQTTSVGPVNVFNTGSLNEVSISNPASTKASSSQAGINVGNVAVTDNGAESSTIATVSVSGYAAFAFGGTALTTLNVANGSGNIIIDNSGLTSPTNKTLALGVDGLGGGTLDDADVYTTLNVTTSGSNSTLTNITTGGVTALNIGGTAALTLTSTAGLTKLNTVSVTKGAGLTADLSAATVTDVDTSGTSGAIKVTINASKATFEGGTGTTTVTTTADPVSKAITLGDGVGTVILGSSTAPTAKITAGNGTSDTIQMTAALAATASADAKFAGIVTGFENLTLTSATNQTVDLAVLGGYINVNTAAGNGLTLANFVTGGDLTLTGVGTAYTLSNSKWATGLADTVNLNLTDGSGSAINFAGTGITASGLEIVNITVADTQATPTGGFNDLVTLLGNSFQSVVVTGNAGLTLAATSTALTTVDASGITLGGFTFTSGALAGAAVIKGSATGTNTIDASAATALVTYTGGTGNDSVTINNTKNNVADLGSGNNTYTGGAGSNAVTAGDGNDTVTVTSGNNTVSLGGGANTFTATIGNNVYTGGSGVDTVTVAGGVNTLTLGSGADKATFTAVTANVNTYSDVKDASAGDTLGLINQGTETFGAVKVTLGDTAVFQDYANAVIAQGGNASVNGYVGWFQFSGNTYVVQSLHDGSGVNASFVNGTDFIVKLTGLVDLSTANLAGNDLTLA